MWVALVPVVMCSLLGGVPSFVCLCFFLTGLAWCAGALCCGACDRVRLAIGCAAVHLLLCAGVTVAAVGGDRGLWISSGMLRMGSFMVVFRLIVGRSAHTEFTLDMTSFPDKLHTGCGILGSSRHILAGTGTSHLRECCRSAHGMHARDFWYHLRRCGSHHSLGYLRWLIAQERTRDHGACAKKSTERRQTKGQTD